MLKSRTWLHVGLYAGLGIATIAALENTWHSVSNALTDWSAAIALPVCLISSIAIWRQINKPSAVLATPLNRAGLQEQLQQVKQSIAKISDLASREALYSQAEQVAHNLEQNQFRIAIFGTSSAGKTSIINALLGRTVGKTASNHGTTTTAHDYEYEPSEKLPEPTTPQSHQSKINRRISLLDTPGIAEAGTAGLGREVLAQQIAKSADLLVFVTAGDLTATEYQELVSLSKLNKRIILAFNKTDLYLASDRDSILAQLQARTAHFLSPQDIVAIAAQPNPIKVRQYASPSEPALVQEWLEPVPADVSLLKNRIETILSGEWESLLIANTAQQIQNLQESARTVLSQTRQLEVDKIVQKYQTINAATVFASPVPGLDLVASAAINTQMLIEIGKLYEKPLTLKQAQKYATVMAETLLKFGCVEAATVAIAACLKTNALTYAIGGSVQAISAAYLTYVGGSSFAAYLQQETTANQPLNINTALSELCLSKFKNAQSGKFIVDFVNNAVTQISANLSNSQISTSSR